MKYNAFLLRTYLHPIEKTLLASRDFKKIDTISSLFYFFKFCFVWEHIETFNWIFGFSIAKLESFDALGIIHYSNQALSAIWCHHLAIVVHSACLKLNQWLLATSCCSSSKSELLQHCKVHSS